MKKHLILPTFFLISTLFLQGCARYQASALTSVSPELIREAPRSEGVLLAAKGFSQEECLYYLDRDVLHRGYKPVQLHIENASERTYLFSTERLSLNSAPPEEVAKKMHTSTPKRILTYTALSVALPFCLIPAIVDGIKSARANEQLDQDFMLKCAKDQVIYPHTHVDMLIFVPFKDYQQNFTLTLLDEESNKPKRLFAHIH